MNPRIVPNTLIEAIDKARHIWIFTHVSPDGDTLGSGFGLAFALLSKGKTVEVFCQDTPGEMYDFMRAEIPLKKLDQAKKTADLTISVDVSNLERLGDLQPLFEASKETANIDHHIGTQDFATHNYLYLSASTAELVMDVIDALDVKLDKNIAQNLWIGMVTDTGGFGYSNTTGDTLRAAARMIDAGVDPSPVNDLLYHRRSIQKTRLMGFALSKIELFCHATVGVIRLSQADIAACSATDADTEGLVEMIRDIDTVEVAVFLREKSPGYCKASLRSKAAIDVQEIAAVFGGGGHIRASGCSFDASLDEACRLLVHQIAISLGESV